ncbi:precorrin-6A synthase (deacetylating) [Pseudomonas syringae]|uniref:Precorrin 6A synthase n=1 Tax=Pseudomonas syringae TaxID=317 RepID=A0A085VQ69_PSESX|nr:precorrin-6A synthase (deacetylating) [Pseudomonas syringae]KFE57582.1 precorrin 6A synthase [Pseudomonas syringae]
MKTILLIGIGSGNPEQITIQAINGLNRAKVLFILDKGYADDSLLRLRKEICERYIRGDDYRLLQISDSRREDDPLCYQQGVGRWHKQRAELFQRLISEEVGPDQTAAFLIWGDPSLYDSTLRILELVLENASQAFDIEVIPGISSVQALAAQHRIALNRIGEPILITTGRQLAQDPGQVPENTVVMLDAHCTFEQFLHQGLHIYWGAYLGTPDEILISGPLDEVCERIKQVRSQARREKGWMMDTYLLRSSE